MNRIVFTIPASCKRHAVMVSTFSQRLPLRVASTCATGMLAVSILLAVAPVVSRAQSDRSTDGPSAVTADAGEAEQKGDAQPAQQYGRHEFEDFERDHWAFQPLRRPAIPAVENLVWVRNPIDTFILAALEEEGLRPAPPADRATLLRRFYLDLIGLPPTPEEQEALLADTSPGALAGVVGDLLSRPEYGERWARHWLDVVRYAESNGYERDGAKPNVWRYRDYVIDSLNADKPFDRFVVEQLAGDEIEGSSAETQIATTFLRLGPWDDEPADPLVDRCDQLDDVLGTTATAFLGLTLQCARCHDHKFEPFTQRDYYRMMAHFTPLKRPQNNRTDLDRLVGTDQELSKYREAMEEADRQVAEFQPRIDSLKLTIRDRMFTEDKTTLPEEAVAAFQKPADERDEAERKLVKEHRGKLDEEIQGAATEEERAQLDELTSKIDATNAARPPEPPRAYIWYEEPDQLEPTFVLQRGNPRTPAEEIPPGLPAVLVDRPPEEPTPTDKSSHRRLPLARWIASPQNPLTARVIVNRLWQRHFGEGLVASESDFGLMGEAPSHPELLDWLATELIANGWHLKAIHRLIVLSSTYQMSSATSAEGEDFPPRLHRRWQPRRLEAEAIRDSILAASGALSTKRGGPSIFPKISKAVLATQSRPGSGWTSSDSSEANRRSIYIFVKRTLLVPEMEILDFPNTNVSCEQRMVSTIAPQALTFLNGEFIHTESARLAARLQAEAGDDPTAQIDRAFRLSLCRPPTDEERSACLDFLNRQQQQIQSDAPDDELTSSEARRRALTALCLVLLNTNEFVYFN